MPLTPIVVSSIFIRVAFGPVPDSKGVKHDARQSDFRLPASLHDVSRTYHDYFVSGYSQRVVQSIITLQLRVVLNVSLYNAKTDSD